MAKYILLDIKAPEVVPPGVAVKDPGVGGIKLTYQKFKNFSTVKDTGNYIFLKPYKDVWSINGKKGCRKGEWGSTRSPFANVWLKIYKDYTDYNIAVQRCELYYEVVKDPKLIKNLNKVSNGYSISNKPMWIKEFDIYESDDKVINHPLLKIAIWMYENIINPIRNRIFINQN